MSLSIASLNSGSNGNCYYIGNDEEAVLVDVGISCKETEKRMARMGLAMEKVKAVFISHEHTDHVSGANTLSKKYGLPVYITRDTLKNSRLGLDKNLIMPFHASTPILIGNLAVVAFSKAHDAKDPHSFVVKHKNTCVGIFTDIGKCCDNTVHYFSQCNAAFLEANYDEEMLETGSYPYHLKQRISGGNGHLSNKEALKLFIENRSPFLSHLVLSHLSKNNNKPELVQELFNRHAGTTEIIIASRYQESEVYQIGNVNNIVVSRKKKTSDQRHLQLSMF